MQLQVHREPFVQTLGRVSGVIERHQTLPILGHFLIRASEGTLSLFGSDLELELRAQCSAEVTEPGECTLPARKLLAICRALPKDATIQITQKDQRATIRAGRSRFTLGTLPPQEFPFMEGGGTTQAFPCPQELAAVCIGKTQFAMANGDARFYLNGLFLKLSPQGITAVATDGHRLAKLERAMELPITEPLEVIVPRKAVLELGRLMRDGDLHLDIGSMILRAGVGDVHLTTKLINGRYPDYERVIPQSPEKQALLDREAFRQALLRTAILSNEKYRGVRLTFERDRLRLHAQNPEQDAAEEDLEIQYAQETTTIGFNVTYLVDVLNTLEEERVAFQFTDALSSALIRGEGQADQTYVVMPMRL